jgi:lipopolysaccharide transport system permease protein
MPPMSTSAGVRLREIEIRPFHGWRSLGLGDLWEHRHLAWYMAARDLKVRYKQTALGGIWVIAQPLMTVVVFTIVFGGLAGIPSDGVPYPVFAMAGLLPWNFFTSCLSRSSASLYSASGLISKVYFPRFVLPVSSVLVTLVDLAVSTAVLIALVLWYHVSVMPSALFVLPLLVIALAAALGFGLLISAMSIRYRDLSHALPYLTQLALYATPIIYPVRLTRRYLERVGLPEWALGLNPMAGVVAGFRDALFGSRTLTPGLLALSTLVAVSALVAGAFVFRRVESTVVDRI